MSEKKANNKKRNGRASLKVMARLFSYFKYDKKSLFFGLGLLIISNVGMVALSGMLSPIIDSIVIDRDLQILARNLMNMLILTLVVSSSSYFGNRYMINLAHNTIYRLRDDMFSKMQSLPISYFDSKSHGSIMSTYTNDVAILIMALEESVSQIVSGLIIILGTFIMFFILSPSLTLVVLLVLVLMLLAVRLVGQLSSKYYRRRQETTASMNAFVEEMVSGQRVIKVFNHEDETVCNFENINEELRKDMTASSALGVVMMPILGNLSYVMYALVAIFGSFQVISGQMSLGNITAFLQYTRTITRPISSISQQFNNLFAAAAGCERIFDLIDEEPELDEGEVSMEKVSEEEAYWIIPKGDGGEERRRVKGDIRFDHVYFGYNEDNYVLKDINLFAKPGQRLALVGSTGAGKTTITNLINRFYDVNDGTITFDGINIKDINKKDLRGAISIVLQDVVLFTGTVYDNIRYGRLNASDKDVETACRLANADGFIKRLPDGYNTVLENAGGNLSQGERQLLSIARAAIADPTVLILDEATSSVDTHTEKLINEGMDSLMIDRTTFAIAHRLSTIRDSNAIMVMEKGEIIERGSHDELMAQKGVYYQLNTGQQELT